MHDYGNQQTSERREEGRRDIQEVKNFEQIKVKTVKRKKDNERTE